MEPITKQQVVFSESCVPPLKNGEYELRVTQQTTQGTSQQEKQTFFSEGARFGVGLSEIDSVFPPQNATGTFGLALPHIVLKRKTFPWERTVAGIRDNDKAIQGKPAMEQPWVALLSLHAAEISDLEQTDSFKTGTAGELLCKKGSSPAVVLPSISIPAAEKAEMCTVVDLPAPLLAGILPTPDEMALLCHARAADDAASFSSVVIGNRLPASTAEGSANRVLLVSLEGHSQLFGGLPMQGNVRLVVLHSWDYVSVAGNAAFSLQEQLSRLAVLPAGEKPQDETPQDDMEALARKLEALGYVPLVHQLRNGDSTVSLYKGPLVPTVLKTGIEEALQSGASADRLLIYDSQTGLFDITYAAAWQLGQLLALGEKSVATRLMQQRAKNHNRVHRRQMDACLFGACESFSANNAAEADAHSTGVSLLHLLANRMEALL